MMSILINLCIAGHYKRDKQMLEYTLIIVDYCNKEIHKYIHSKFNKNIPRKLHLEI